MSYLSKKTSQITQKRYWISSEWPMYNVKNFSKATVKNVIDKHYKAQLLAILNSTNLGNNLKAKLENYVKHNPFVKYMGYGNNMKKSRSTNFLLRTTKNVSLAGMKLSIALSAIRDLSSGVSEDVVKSRIRYASEYARYCFRTLTPGQMCTYTSIPSTGNLERISGLPTAYFSRVFTTSHGGNSSSILAIYQQAKNNLDKNKYGGTRRFYDHPKGFSRNNPYLMMALFKDVNSFDDYESLMQQQQGVTNEPNSIQMNPQ